MNGGWTQAGKQFQDRNVRALSDGYDKQLANARERSDGGFDVLMCRLQHHQSEGG